jgi:hypothetical protein
VFQKYVVFQQYVQSSNNTSSNTRQWCIYNSPLPKPSTFRKISVTECV